jgi:hypothetical protein
LSSILKALKRVEEESPPPQPYQSLPRPIDPKLALNAKTRIRWHLRRLVFVLLVAALFIGGAATIYSQRELILARLSFLSTPDSPSSEVSESNRNGVYRAKIPEATSKTAAQPKKVDQRPTTTKNKRSAAADQSKRPESRTKPVSRRSSDRQAASATTFTGAQRPPTERKAKITRPSKRVSAPSSANARKKTAAKKDVKSTDAELKRPKPVRRNPPQNYDRIETDKLRLQALAWADNADGRMAVINNRIVHEGESVDGYQVFKIREDDVIVNQGGKSWRLEFGLQR